MPGLSARKADRVGRYGRRGGHGKRKPSKSQAAKNWSLFGLFLRLPWRSLGIVITVLMISAGTLKFWSSGEIVEGIDDIRLAMLDSSISAGLAIDEIYVEGRNRAPRDELLAALGLARGDAILGVDLDEAKARLEAVGWVSSATVQRRLPDALYVRIVERQPAALWQHDGEMRVVDMSGAIITETHVSRFAHLPHIVGEKAPEHFPTLLRTLARTPSLSGRISAAVWVGDRRWNLRFDNRIDVKLPEDALDEAWQRLEQLQKREKVLDTNIVVLDLRQADRVAARLHPDAKVEEDEASDA